MLILLFLFISSFSPALLKSECPDVQPLENFDIPVIVTKGLWYQIARYPIDTEFNQECVHYSVSSVDSNGFVGRKFDIKKNSSEFLELNAIRSPDANGKGIMDVTLNTGSKSKKIHANIFAIEYPTIFVSYACEYDKKNNVIQEFAWILTNKKPSSDKDILIKNFVKANKVLDYNKFIWIDHLKCNDVY